MERRQKVTAGRRQPTFIKGRVFFFFLQEDAMMLEILLQDDVHILVYVWCSSFVQYIVLVEFLHFNMYPSLNDLHRPWECLI